MYTVQDAYTSLGHAYTIPPLNTVLATIQRIRYMSALIHAAPIAFDVAIPINFDMELSEGSTTSNGAQSTQSSTPTVNIFQNASQNVYIIKEH